MLNGNRYSINTIERDPVKCMNDSMNALFPEYLYTTHTHTKIYI